MVRIESDPDWHSALETDYYIGLNCTNVTINTYIIKDESGLISTNGLVRISSL